MPFNFWYQVSDGAGGWGATQSGSSQSRNGADWAVISGIAPDTDYRWSTDSATGPWTNGRTLPAEVIPADRDPVTTTIQGGRQVVTPARYYEKGAAEFADPVAHPHIMGVTHRTVKTGRFTDPTVWNTGTVPGAGSVWAVSAGHTLIGDNNSDTIFLDALIEVGGTFRLATDTDTKWRLDTFMNMGNRILADKSPSTTQGRTKHEFIWHIQTPPGATTRGGLMGMGSERFHGAKKKSHLRVGVSGAQTVPAAMAGATSVRLPGLAQSGWRVGQVMVFGGTRHLDLALTDADYTGVDRYWDPRGSGTLVRMVASWVGGFQFGQEEQRTITAIDGDVASFAEPLVYDHVGIERTLAQGQTITIAPVVGNPSQSIEFRTASAEEDGHLDPTADLTDLQKRGHAMIMRSPDVDVRYCSFKNMGRTNTDPTLWVDDLPTPAIGVPGSAHPLYTADPASGGVALADPVNVRGRYALHFHWCGGPYLSSPLVPCIGVSTWAPLDAPPIPGWALTAHGSRIGMEDCFAFNFRGAGFVWELGNEAGHAVGNLAMFGRGDGQDNAYGDRHEIHPNHNGAAGVGFDFQSRMIQAEDNIVVSCKYAYLWHAQKSTWQDRWLRGEDVRFKEGFYKKTNGSGQTSQDDYLGHMNAQIPPFLRNEAHACQVGFNVIHRLGSIVGGQDKTPMLVEEFHCLDVPEPWLVDQYSHWYLMKDCLWHRNSYGGSGARMGNVSWGWSFSNIHLVNFATQMHDSGTGLNYDGFFFDITWEGGGQFSNNFNVSRTGVTSEPAFGVMGDAVVTDANSGTARVYRNLSVEDLPQPYPTTALGGYGGVLPAGYEFPEPGEAPYFIPDAGNTTSISAGDGLNRGTFTGRIVDSAGVHKWPDAQSSESALANTSVKSPRNLGKMQPEQLVQWWGCWFDGTNWRTRAWFPIADRYTHVKSHFSIELILNGFNAAFLAIHDIGGPPSEPAWPKVEAIPAEQPPIKPVTKSLRFLSRTRIEAVAGNTLVHPLVVDDVNVRLEIVGGADATAFRIFRRQLQWANNGSQASGTYVVVIRVTDIWANRTDQEHTVTVVPSAGVLSEVIEPFTYADQNLEDTGNWTRLRGPVGTFAIRSNRLSLTQSTSPSAVYTRASLGTSDMEVFAEFRNSNSGNHVLMRVVDADNWIGLMRNDGGPYMALQACIGGVITRLVEFPNASGSRVRVRLRGRRVDFTIMYDSNREPDVRFPRAGQMRLLLPLEQDPLSEPGVFLLPETVNGAPLPMGTMVGVSGSGTTNPWLDNFEARALTDIGVPAAAAPTQPAPTYPTLTTNMVRPGVVSTEWDARPLWMILVNWHNGVLTTGNPDFVTFNADDSADLHAEYVDGSWNSGILQFNRPTAGQGRWGWVVSSENANAVNAMFIYADSGFEIDWEYIINPDASLGTVGARGWLMTVHMPRPNTGARASMSRFIPYTAEQWLTPTLFEIVHDDTQARWYIDGELVATVTRAELEAAFADAIWTTDAPAASICSVERHASWAGWPSYTTSDMKVWGMYVPGLG